MKTPFTPHFRRASIPLTRVSREPFKPLYAMPFVQATCTEYWVGGLWQLIYRWHDGFDVFVATLEARMGNAADTVVELPVESFLHDLHLVYQLAGRSRLPGLALPAQHHTQVYTAPARGTLRIQAAAADQRYALCVAVPKGKWVCRSLGDPANLLGRLVGCLAEKRAAHRSLKPAPISSAARVWVHLLLATPRYAGMNMDVALYRPLAKLVDVHLAEHALPTLGFTENRRLENARLFAREWVERMSDGTLPTTDLIERMAQCSMKTLWLNHKIKYHITYRRYFLQCRLAEAKHRLLQLKSVSTVAYELGWTEIANFSRDFKNEFGQSPKQFLSTRN